MRRNKLKAGSCANDRAETGNLGDNSLVVGFLEHEVDEAANAFVDAVDLVGGDRIRDRHLLGHLARDF